MADISSKNASVVTSIVGADSTGTETNFVSADSSGALFVKLKDVNYDAFGRVRISNPDTHFETTFSVDKQPLIFSEAVTGSSTVTHDANMSSVVLTTTNTATSSAVFASRMPFKYHPGKSNLLLITGSFIEAKAGTSKYFGQYDANNGYYFLLDGTDLKFGIRSSTSGSVVDTTVARANWNGDKLDGTGLSGVTLDLTKQQIMFIDYQWLGSGAVRFGFVINGEIIVCHSIFNANSLSTPYSKTATLPIRVECISTSANAATSLRFTCTSLMSEGGTFPDFGNLISVNNGSTPITFAGAGTTLPLIAVRLRSGVTNAVLEPVEFSAFGNSADDFLVSIVKNPTLTGGTWISTGDVSEYNRSATAVSGGTILYSVYVRGNTTNQAIISDILEMTFSSSVGYTVSGTPDILAITATNITANATLFSALTCREVV